LCWRHRSRRPAEAVLVSKRPVPGGIRPTASAMFAGPSRPRWSRRGRGRARAAPCGSYPIHLRRTTRSMCRMGGCLPTRGASTSAFRADHVGLPPAAAGAPRRSRADFVGRSFCPRKVTTTRCRPGALQPRNVDSDELLFYVGGNYEARKGSGIRPRLAVAAPLAARTAASPAPSRLAGCRLLRRRPRHRSTLPPLGNGRGRGGLRGPELRLLWARRLSSALVRGTGSRVPHGADLSPSWCARYPQRPRGADVADEVDRGPYEGHPTAECRRAAPVGAWASSEGSRIALPRLRRTREPGQDQPLQARGQPSDGP